MTDNSALWVLPEQYGPDTTADQLTAQITLDHSAMFPQTLTDTVPCDHWGQADVYNADPTPVTEGGVLSWVNGHPEDSDIYVSHTWVYGGDCVVVTPPPMTCEEGFVPGWLDENGNPQGCVNNGNPDPAPTVEVPAPPTTPDPTSQLAETGADPLLALLAVALVALGVLCMWVRKRA